MTTKTMDLLCGIDIGSDQVRTVLARAPENSSDTEGATQLEVLAVGQAESRNSVQYGEVVRQRGATEAVRQAVEEVEQTAGVEVGSAFVSVGSRTRRSINSSGAISILEPRHRIGEADVYRAVMAAVPRDGGTAWLRPPYELLHALPQEFWVDDLDPTDDPTGWTGEKIESFVHLVSCPRATLHNIEEAVNGAGIRVERLVAAPLATGYGVLAAEERQEGVVLLDIGAMTTDIAVFRRGVLWHSDLMPSGGRAYTRDLAYGLKTSHAHAEHAKRRHGVALVDKVPEDEYFEIQVSGGGYPKQWRRRLLADVLQRRAESDPQQDPRPVAPRASGDPGHLGAHRGRSQPRRAERRGPTGIRRRRREPWSPGADRAARSGDASPLRLRHGPLPLRPAPAPANTRDPFSSPRDRRRPEAGRGKTQEAAMNTFPAPFGGAPQPPQGANP